MDLNLFVSTLLAVVGIVVSVGLWRISEWRTARRRWQGAKELILRDLSRALGEGSAPDLEVVLATIRSVLRAANAPTLTVITIQEISDDLIRQVAADPFLERARKDELERGLLKLVNDSAGRVPAAALPQASTYSFGRQPQGGLPVVVRFVVGPLVLLSIAFVLTAIIGVVARAFTEDALLQELAAAMDWIRRPLVVATAVAIPVLLSNALLWRVMDFIDALWRKRFGPPTGPSEEAVVTPPPGTS